VIMIKTQGEAQLYHYVEPMHTVSKQWHHTPQLYQLLSASLLVLFNPLYSSTNQQLFSMSITNGSHHMSIYHTIDTFCGER